MFLSVCLFAYIYVYVNSSVCQSVCHDKEIVPTRLAKSPLIMKSEECLSDIGIMIFAEESVKELRKI